MAEPPQKKARMEDDHDGNKSDSNNQESDEQYNASQDMFANSMEEESVEDGRFNQSYWLLKTLIYLYLKYVLAILNFIQDLFLS